jgi:hypothetical protein
MHAATSLGARPVCRPRTAASGGRPQGGLKDVEEVSHEAVGTTQGGGAVNALPGSAGLLAGVGSQLFT